MKILVLLLATLAVVNAMENFFPMGGDYADEMGVAGNGCCLPTQWEGRVGSVHITKRFLRPRVIASDSKIGFNFSGKKVAARTMYYCPFTKKIYETRTVADFNAQKAYFIFEDKCKTFSYKRPLVKPCIPDFYKQFPAYFYGAGNTSLALTPYGYRKGSLALFQVVTKDSCVPIKAAYYLKRGFLSSMAGKYQYFNITAGNTDKDLYNVPAFCYGANATRYETRGLWRKFQKFAGYGTDEPFNPESQFGSLVQSDSMSQLMDIIDNNVMLTDVQKNPKSGRDKWFKNRWDRVTSRLRQFRDRKKDD